MLGLFKAGQRVPKARTKDPVKKTRAKKVPQIAEPKIPAKKLPTDIRELLADAKEEALRVMREAQDEASKIRKETIELEKKLVDRQEEIDKKLAQAAETQKVLAAKKEEIEKMRTDMVVKLEKISSLSKEEAKKLILDNLEQHLAEEIGKKVREAEDQIRAQSSEKAKEILVEAMQHGATDWVLEYTTSMVRLPTEEVKGRIIGKEGRNIRAFEESTGVEVLLDEEIPQEARISSFDAVRREIARRALERLVKDGRIQPQRIEDEVSRARGEVERDMTEAGRRALHEAGIFNIADPEVLDLVGRLKFRLSYGQNQLISSIESSKMADHLAAEIGADRNVAKVGAFFHDVGKAITDKEGTHVQLGVEFLTRKGFPKKVIDCVAQHHEDQPFTSVESILVHLADAISSSRPGARHEDVQEYIKRLSEIEERAKVFRGVKEAFAIAAGREVRVIVNPDEISDAETDKIAHDIAEKLAQELTYPGQIKVNVIREKRAVAFAS